MPLPKSLLLLPNRPRQEQSCIRPCSKRSRQFAILRPFSLQCSILPHQYKSELWRILQPSLYHISKSLLNDEPYLRALLDTTALGQSDARNSNDLHHHSRAFGRLISLLCVMEQLGSLRSEETAALWLQPLSSKDPHLVEGIFQCVEKCEAELLLPVKMPGDQVLGLFCLGGLPNLSVSGLISYHL